VENRTVTAGIQERANGEYMPPTTGEAIRLLKNAFRWYYNKYGYNTYAKTTAKLKELLETGSLRYRTVRYKADFTLPEETETEAKCLCSLFRRQNCLFQMRAMLHVFAKQEYDLMLSKHGALYYPELRMYVHCGHPSPNNLLKILAEPSCGQAALFSPTQAHRIGDARYLLFERRDQPTPGTQPVIDDE
jgi:hypothetical protein